ncbi:cytidylyltransferase domain-containing protein [Haloferax profundi]|uniref:Acylneuraminate cytidylyltransferase n=1 Tax=Haloferax profundi TaxID=1544718 RepID=A0A0W1SWW3_9EURY|nr:glycosyltransferase family protein [Haloferax profundi]KTG30924.1 hypothetical protein AUR66_05565 [Haloferax profundi]
MKTVAVIQARMGSSRLPGKVMLPLDCVHNLERVVSRVLAAKTIDEVVVATTTHARDDIIAQCAPRFGAAVSRGDEQDVLGRMYEAACSHDADIVVRITGDCPLIPPECADAVVEKLQETGADYASNIVERTFPRGFDVEAFTMDSFERVEYHSTEPHQREHVTQLYLNDDTGEFVLANISSHEVYEKDSMQDRSDLRLTLDEAKDYELLRIVYDSVEFEEILDVEEAVSLIDEKGLTEINGDVGQKPTR